MAEVSSLGAAVFKSLMTEAGGKLSDDVLKRLHHRLPSFGERELIEVIKSDRRATDIILKEFYDQLSEACGSPDDPPNYTKIAELIAIFPDPESRTEIVQLLRNLHPWLAGNFDRAAWDRQMRALAEKEAAFFTAVRDLAGHDLESFVLSLLEEHRRVDAHVSSLAIRMIPTARALQLPEPCPEMFRTFAAVAAALEHELNW